MATGNKTQTLARKKKKKHGDTPWGCERLIPKVQSKQHLNNKGFDWLGFKLSITPESR